MRETLRRIFAIFRKDVRQLWPHVLVLLVVLVGIPGPQYMPWPRGSSLYFVLGIPLVCWSLVIAVIHSDRLVGDRQYWLTRPYSRTELFLAKVLFLAVFAFAPVFANQLAILLAAGIPPMDHLTVLWWNQVRFAAFLWLPALALAAATRNVTEAVLGAGLLWIPWVWLGGDIMDWARAELTGVILLAGVAVILWLQYARRATAVSRAAIVATTVLMAITAARERTYAHEAPVPPRAKQSEIQVAFDSRERRAVDWKGSRYGDARLDMPIRITGVEPGMEIVAETMKVGFRGSRVSLGEAARARISEVTSGPDGRGWQTFHIEREDYENFRDDPLDFYGSMELVVYRNRLELPLPGTDREVIPDVGVCKTNWVQEGFAGVQCLSPQPRAFVQFQSIGEGVQWIIHPGSTLSESFPGVASRGMFRKRPDRWMVMWSLPIPLFRAFQPLELFSNAVPLTDEDKSEGRLIVGTPVKQVQVTFEFPKVRMSDFSAESGK